MSCARPATGLDQVLSAALAEEVLLLRDGDCSDCEAWLERCCAARGIALRRRHSIAGEDRLQQMVAAGLGVALCGERQSAAAGTVVRPLADENARRAVMLAAVVGRPQGPAVAALLKLTRASDWRHSPPSTPRRAAPPQPSD